MLHPFMPFITEEIWQLLEDRKDGESLMISRISESKRCKKEVIGRFEIIKEIVSSVRTVRKEKDLPGKEKISLYIKADKKDFDKEFLPAIIKLCNLSSIEFTSKKPDESVSFMVHTTELFIPLPSGLDKQGELLKIREDLDYYRGFLGSVMRKLENERFVRNAPQNVLELERKKKSDTESKIRSLEERIKELED
jgi:valyl-tRNA synthetase